MTAHIEDVTAHADAATIQIEAMISHTAPLIAHVEAAVVYTAPGAIKTPFVPTALAHKKWRIHFIRKGVCSIGAVKNFFGNWENCARKRIGSRVN